MESKSEPLFLREFYGSFRTIIIKPSIHFHFLSGRHGQLEEILPGLADKGDSSDDQP